MRISSILATSAAFLSVSFAAWANGPEYMPQQLRMMQQVFQAYDLNQVETTQVAFTIKETGRFVHASSEDTTLSNDDLLIANSVQRELMGLIGHQINSSASNRPSKL